MSNQKLATAQQKKNRSNVPNEISCLFSIFLSFSKIAIRKKLFSYRTLICDKNFYFIGIKSSLIVGLSIFLHLATLIILYHFIPIQISDIVFIFAGSWLNSSGTNLVAVIVQNNKLFISTLKNNSNKNNNKYNEFVLFYYTPFCFEVDWNDASLWYF